VYSVNTPLISSFRHYTPHIQHYYW